MDSSRHCFDNLLQDKLGEEEGRAGSVSVPVRAAPEKASFGALGAGMAHHRPASSS